MTDAGHLDLLALATAAAGITELDVPSNQLLATTATTATTPQSAVQLNSQPPAAGSESDVATASESQLPATTLPTTRSAAAAAASGITAEETIIATSATSRKYTVRYQNNNSKRWDGKEIVLDGEWLETMYSPHDLQPGKVLSLPWSGKNGREETWSAVVVHVGIKGDKDCLRLVEGEIMIMNVCTHLEAGHHGTRHHIFILYVLQFA